MNWGLENQFSEEDVFRVEGILDVNTMFFVNSIWNADNQGTIHDHILHYLYCKSEIIPTWSYCAY